MATLHLVRQRVFIRKRSSVRPLYLKNASVYAQNISESSSFPKTIRYNFLHVPAHNHNTSFAHIHRIRASSDNREQRNEPVLETKTVSTQERVIALNKVEIIVFFFKSNTYHAISYFSDSNTDVISPEYTVPEYCLSIHFVPTLEKEEEEEERRRRRCCGLFAMPLCCCYCLIATIIGLILLGTIATVVAFLVTPNQAINIPTTTSTTDTSTTSITATTSTASTTTTTTVTTSTTSTFSTTSTSTTSMTATSTSTTTTTTPYNLCANLRWNQTGTIVAGTGTSGSNLSQFIDPTCIEIDANDTMYICDHHNYRIQMWTKGATSGVKIIDTNAIDHFEALTFDKNGYLYLTGHQAQRVVRYSPDFTSNMTVAGVLNTASKALTNLNDPLGMDLDKDFNLYIAERSNKRIVKWSPNATSGTIVIDTNNTIGFYGLLLSLYTTNQVYVSSEDKNAVYLWTFNASIPDVTLTQVNASVSTLKKPRGIQYDIYGNLYVTDKGNDRIVMYCVNSTVGKLAVSDNINTTLAQPDDVAFDSNFNMYVVDDSGQKVIRYDRL